MKVKYSSGQISAAAGTGVTMIIAAILAAGYQRDGAPTLNPCVIILVALMSGSIFGILAIRRMYGWLVGWSLGVLIGILSAAQIYFGPAADDEFKLGLLTYVVLASLGWGVGAVAQFIIFLHRALHRAIKPLERETLEVPDRTANKR